MTSGCGLRSMDSVIDREASDREAGYPEASDPEASDPEGSVSAQPYADLSGPLAEGMSAPALAALRDSRAQRVAVVRRRSKRIGVAVGVILAVLAWRSGPGPGLHGTSLAIAILI